ncbi:UNVERIFIED_CONTAM: movement protein [Sesamum radiatum]|uniref:Movement protein n=1 Tax=Sesamum radiatum TaxID=300843 RepID=A0AAW2U9J7_SESRA
MTVSNKTMERIMRQDSNLSPYDGFRIGGIGKVLNQIGLNQRKHHIIYKVSSGEFAIPMELTGNVMEMQLIPKEEILEELSKLREEVAVTMKWIHIGAIEVVIKATFKEGIDSEIHLSIMDRRINNLRDGCLGTMIGNLYAGKLMFDIHPRIAYNLADQDFSRVLTLHQDFKRKDLMKEGNRPYSITYRIAYALSNTHHSDLFLRKEYIEIPRIFKEFAKQPVIGRYEGMLEIAGHEILVAGVAGKENGSMTLGLNFLEDHKPWGRKGIIEATLKVKEECKYEYVRYKPIQMNMEDKRDMQMIIKEHINLGLIEPGVSAYSSPGFLVRNHGEIKRGILIDETGIELQEHIVEKIRNFPDVLKDKKHLQSFLGVVNFAGIFIKDLAKYRKDFRPLLKETESSKWKWEEIHTQRVRELKQVCSNLPKLAIPQDEDELVVYTDANDYRWAAVLMKKTTTGEEPCGRTSPKSRSGHRPDNHKEFLGSINCAMERSTRTNPQGIALVVVTRELREHDPKHAFRVQGSRPVAADSSTACTRPSSDSDETATIEPQGVQTPDDSSQPSTSGEKEGEISLRPMTGTSKVNTNELISLSSAWQVYQRMWEKLISRKGVNPSKTIVETSGKYNRVWMLEGSKPEDVREMRPDMVAFNKIKVATGEAPLVSAISEDDISTRRAWGLWVCLTEMDKVKKEHEFAESMFERKRMLIWENKLPATEATRMKACNMLHVGQWHNHVCPCCEKQEKPLFGTKIRVTQKKPEPNQDKGKRKNFYKTK